MLGIPDHIRACLFDLDGVITQAGALHEHGAGIVVKDLAELLDKP